MTLFSFVNFLIIVNFFLSILFTILSIKFKNLYFFKLLKFAFEASLVGAIADSYAVFGLFYKLGPHTDIIRKKKKDLIEKVKFFVADFLFQKDYLDRELDNVKIDISDYIDESILKVKVSEAILKKLNNHKIAQKVLKLIINDISEKIVELILKNSKINEKINMKGKQIIKNVIIDNHDIILNLIEKRLNEIDDNEFVDIIKKSSWKELQWIRLNGVILGWFLGIIIGYINIIFCN